MQEIGEAEGAEIDLIDPVLEILDTVGPALRCSEDEGVGVGAAIQVVVPLPAIQRVHSGPAAQGVIPIPAEQHIGPAPTVEAVILTLAEEHVVPAVAEQAVRARTAMPGIVFAAEAADIVTRAEFDGIFAAPGSHEILSRTGKDDFIAVEPEDPVIPVAAVQCRVRVRDHPDDVVATQTRQGHRGIAADQNIPELRADQLLDKGNLVAGAAADNGAPVQKRLHTAGEAGIVHRIRVRATIDHVAAARAADDVVATKRQDDIVAFRPGQLVGSVAGSRRPLRDVGDGDGHRVGVGEPGAVGHRHGQVIPVVAIGIRRCLMIRSRTEADLAGLGIDRECPGIIAGQGEGQGIAIRVERLCIEENGLGRHAFRDADIRDVLKDGREAGIVRLRHPNGDIAGVGKRSGVRRFDAEAIDVVGIAIRRRVEIRGEGQPDNAVRVDGEQVLVHTGQRPREGIIFRIRRVRVEQHGSGLGSFLDRLHRDRVDIGCRILDHVGDRDRRALRIGPSGSVRYRHRHLIQVVGVRIRGVFVVGHGAEPDLAAVRVYGEVVCIHAAQRVGQRIAVSIGCIRGQDHRLGCSALGAGHLRQRVQLRRDALVRIGDGHTDRPIIRQAAGIRRFDPEAVFVVGIPIEGLFEIRVESQPDNAVFIDAEQVGVDAAQRPLDNAPFGVHGTGLKQDRSAGGVFRDGRDGRSFDLRRGVLRQVGDRDRDGVTDGPPRSIRRLDNQVIAVVPVAVGRVLEVRRVTEENTPRPVDPEQPAVRTGERPEDRVSVPIRRGGREHGRVGCPVFRNRKVRDRVQIRGGDQRGREQDIAGGLQLRAVDGGQAQGFRPRRSRMGIGVKLRHFRNAQKIAHGQHAVAVFRCWRRSDADPGKAVGQRIDPDEQQVPIGIQRQTQIKPLFRLRMGEDVAVQQRGHVGCIGHGRDLEGGLRRMASPERILDLQFEDHQAIRIRFRHEAEQVGKVRKRAGAAVGQCRGGAGHFDHVARRNGLPVGRLNGAGARVIQDLHREIVALGILFRGEADGHESGVFRKGTARYGNRESGRGVGR